MRFSLEIGGNHGRFHDSPYLGLRYNQAGSGAVGSFGMPFNRYCFSVISLSECIWSGQSLSNPYTGILSIFSTRIRNGNGINIFEDGKETRDFVYIDDVVDATILGIEKEEANGHVFNVGTGVATDVLTVARTLIEKYEIDVPVTISGNFRLGDIRHNYADITAARTILGFEPKWSFSDGIGEFVKWVNEQGVQEDKYEASIEEMKKKGLYK